MLKSLKEVSTMVPLKFGWTCTHHIFILIYLKMKLNFK